MTPRRTYRDLCGRAFVIWTPAGKRKPAALIVEINPVDEYGLPKKRRGLIIRTVPELETFRRLINDKRLEEIVWAVERLNKPGGEVEEEKFEI
ncbi:MAG: hypothetical protein NZ733_05475 [Aigarchaeota archaeon]|nr:hypothetical protein [Aigarchaeota archaeon]MCS7127253.1 hypothetical protein [Candidatus Calditenuaceae archaeon]MCX8203460.1 hypothetical protein [Nitrososphaeria archaeon]MDW8042708.1 hypothetical protein [Nitrososphaerota archaeon]